MFWIDETTKLINNFFCIQFEEDIARRFLKINETNEESKNQCVKNEKRWKKKFKNEIFIMINFSFRSQNRKKKKKNLTRKISKMKIRKFFFEKKKRKMKTWLKSDETENSDSVDDLKSDDLESDDSKKIWLISWCYQNVRTYCTYDQLMNK